MTIRLLTKEDYPVMLPLYCALDALHVETRPDWFRSRPEEEIFPRASFDALTEDPECLMLGAFDSGGAAVGLLRATLWQDSGMVKGLKNVCLDNIYVLPAYRRRGIASRLYAAAEDWAREQGACRLELHVWEFNRDAMAAYRAWGLTAQRHVLEKNL